MLASTSRGHQGGRTIAKEIQQAEAYLALCACCSRTPPPSLRSRARHKKGVMDRRYLDSMYTSTRTKVSSQNLEKKNAEKRKALSPPPSNESVVDKWTMHVDGLVPPIYVVFWPSLRQAIWSLAMVWQSNAVRELLHTWKWIRRLSAFCRHKWHSAPDQR